MRIEKNFLILLIGRVGQAVLALAALRVLTSLLDKENVGMTYLVASMTSYFSLIFINPIGMYVNRKLHFWFQQKQLLKVFKFLNIYFLSVAILSVPVVLLSHLILHVGTGFFAWQICFLIFLNIYIGTWFQTLCPSLNMLEHRTAFVVINLISQLVGFSASIAAVFIFNKDAFFWLLGLLVGQTLGAILSWIYFLKVSPVRVEADLEDSLSSLFFNRTALLFYLPIAVTTAFMWGQGQSYRIIVESKLGASTLGVLAVGLGIAASIAGLVESLVSQYFYPSYYATISSDEKDSRTKAWQTLCLNALSVYIPSMIFVAAGANFLLRVLVSSHFDESMSLVAWGAAIEFFRMMTNIIYTVSQSEMKTKSTILPYALGAAAVIIGLLFLLNFVDSIKLEYIPALLVVAGFFSFSGMYLSMKQLLPIKWDLYFVGLCFFYSIPFIGMLFMSPYFDSFLGSLLVCGVFGVYLLWVIWRLHLRIEVLRKAL